MPVWVLVRGCEGRRDLEPWPPPTTDTVESPGDSLIYQTPLRECLCPSGTPTPPLGTSPAHC